MGRSLGNEAELAQEYGVSRWVMREAFAITEQDGLTEMRRGRNGGLLVGAAPDRAVAATICNFLLFTRVDADEMTKVRKVVDRVVYVLAATRLDDTHVAAARALLDRPVGESELEQAVAIYDQILRFADNPFVGVFAVALSKLTQCLTALRELPGLEANAHSPMSQRLLAIRRRQLECIIGADPNGAIEAAAAAAEAWTDMFAQAPTPLPSSSPAARSERAEVVARRISSVLHPGKTAKRSAVMATRLSLDILREALAPGAAIAPEPELLATYAIGRHVLHEAIRMLERDGFVQMEMGRHGGLRVGQPSTESVVDRVMDYFALLEVSSADVAPLAAEILVLIAELVALRVRDHGPTALALASDAIEQLKTARGDTLDAATANLWQALADATGNSVIKLFIAIVNRVSQDTLAAPAIDLGAFCDALIRLEDALRAGDVLLSRRAMAQISRGRLLPNGDSHHN